MTEESTPTKPRRLKLIAIIGAALLGLCVVLGIIGSFAGGGDDDTAAAEPTATTQQAAAPTATQEPTVPTEPAQAETRCVPATDALIAAISDGLEIAGDGKIENVQAVRSDDFEQAWFVAGDLEGPSLDGNSQIAVWVTNDLDGAGMIYSVNSFANEFSQWGDGGATDAGFSMQDDGALDAENCARE